MTDVKFLDLKRLNSSMASEFHSALDEVLESGYSISGPQVEAFESEFARFQLTANCVGTANGFDALHLGLRALNIGHGDEVIVPAHTFIATWLAVSYSGATIVPVDVEQATGNLDPSLMEDAITARTRAVVPVHLYGRICNMAAISNAVLGKGIHIIEDAAQAHGATYEGRRAGAFGDLAGFSFYPGKNLGALGDAGAVISNDRDLVTRIRRFANYGADTKYHHIETGVNSRLDELQAAFLRIKLKHLEQWNARRREIAALYMEHLSGTPLQLPVPDCKTSISAWHLFVVRTADREGMAKRLSDQGVSTLVHYPIPPFLQKAYQWAGWQERLFPVSTLWARECLSLPIDPMMSDGDVQRVIDAVLRAIK